MGRVGEAGAEGIGPGAAWYSTTARPSVAPATLAAIFKGSAGWAAFLARAGPTPSGPAPGGSVGGAG
jgi:hypothetical protein